MSTIITIVLTVLVSWVILVGYSLCVIAGQSDRSKDE